MAGSCVAACGLLKQDIFILFKSVRVLKEDVNVLFMDYSSGFGLAGGAPGGGADGEGLGCGVGGRCGFDDLGEGCISEGCFDGGGGLVEAFVKGAEGVFVGFEAQGAGVNAFDGVDGVDDLKDGYFPGGAGEGEAAFDAAVALDNAGAGKALENFGEVIQGNLHVLCDLLAGALGVGILGEVDDGAQSVFDGLGEEHFVPLGLLPG